MNLLTRLFALHFDRSFSGKGWRQLAWLFGVIVTVFLLIYLVSFAFIFPEPSLEEWTGIDKDVPMGRLLQLIVCSLIRGILWKYHLICVGSLYWS